MSPELEVTREMVQGVSDEIKLDTGGRYWPGELSWLVYEVLTNQLGLPWKKAKGMNIPDDNDPRVKELRGKLDKFDFTARRTEHLKKLRYQFSEITYAETLPDPDTLLAVADSSSVRQMPSLSAVLVDREGKKDVVFTSLLAVPAPRAVLQKEDQDFKVVDSAQIWLADSGKIMWIHLTNPWGENSQVQRQNISVLLGKINPRLFVKKEVFPKISIDLGPGTSTLFWYASDEEDLLDARDKSHGTVPSLL